MDFHAFDADRATKLDDPAGFRFVSREELLSHLSVTSEHVVAGLGSGTGFLTDEVAPHVGTLCTVDVQAVIHDYCHEKGASGSAEFVAADVASLPFDDDHLDTAFSMVTYHEFATDEVLAEFARVVHPGDTVVVVDWSTSGSNEDGPPRDEWFDLGDAISMLEAADFAVTRSETRRETFACIARR